MKVEIPSRVMEKLNLKIGDSIVFEEDDNNVCFHKSKFS